MADIHREAEIGGAARSLGAGINKCFMSPVASAAGPLLPSPASALHGSYRGPAATLVAPPVLNAPGICPVEPPIAQNESPSLGSPTGDVAPARPAEASFVPS
jgi:hypothetical protein